MNAVSRPAPVPLVDWIKGLASQLIMWHHFLWYGPLGVAAATLWPEWADWLRQHGRVAVQCFLVVGGFLSARSLAPRPWHVQGPDPREWFGLVWRRYWRLARPYGAALLMALACAWLARQLGQDPDTPAAPTEWGLLANLLFIHDLVGQPALSAGFWYVAIDLQLFALFAALVVLRRHGERGTRLNRICRLVSLLGTVSLCIASLLWLNLDPSIDHLAPYFFGAYGLGILAHWIHAQPRRGGLLLAMAAMVAVAMFVEWRSRVGVAGVVALLLAAQPGAAWWSGLRLHRLMQWLSRVSYGCFLMHYPLLLLVGTLMDLAWPDSPWLALAGLCLTWGLSLAAGWALHHAIEQAPARAPRAAGAARPARLTSQNG